MKRQSAMNENFKMAYGVGVRKITGAPITNVIFRLEPKRAGGGILIVYPDTVHLNSGRNKPPTVSAVSSNGYVELDMFYYWETKPISRKNDPELFRKACEKAGALCPEGYRVKTRVKWNKGR